MYFQKWQRIFPNHPASKLSLAIYLEALDDLTPEILEIGCLQATRTAEQFPKPGHIRNAALAHSNPEFLGPDLLDYLEITPQEREAIAIEVAPMLDKLRAQLGVKTSNPSKKKFVPVKMPLSLEEGKAELKRRGLL